MISNYNYEIIENYSYNFFVFPIFNKIITKKSKKIVNIFPNSFSEAYTF